MLKLFAVFALAIVVTWFIPPIRDQQHREQQWQTYQQIRLEQYNQDWAKCDLLNNWYKIKCQQDLNTRYINDLTKRIKELTL